MHAGALAAAHPLRLVTPPELHRTQSNGHTSRDKQETQRRETQLRTAAFALLDENPGMSRNALRAALRVRRETAARLYAQWQHARAWPHTAVGAQ